MLPVGLPILLVELLDGQRWAASSGGEPGRLAECAAGALSRPLPYAEQARADMTRVWEISANVRAILPKWEGNEMQWFEFMSTNLDTWSALISEISFASVTAGPPKQKCACRGTKPEKHFKMLLKQRS